MSDPRDLSTKPKQSQTRDIAYGLYDMRYGDKLDVCEKQIKQLMERKPTEVYFDILHTPNQTPQALTWKPEVEAMIEVLNQRPAIFSIVMLNTNPRTPRAKNELYKKAYYSNTRVETREMRAE